MSFFSSTTDPSPEFPNLALGYDQVLFAVGRRPLTNLNLGFAPILDDTTTFIFHVKLTSQHLLYPLCSEAAGVELNEKGYISVDPFQVIRSFQHSAIRTLL